MHLRYKREVSFVVTLPSDVARIPQALMPADTNRPPAHVLGLVAAALRQKLAETSLASAGFALQAELDARVLLHDFVISVTAIGEGQPSQITATATSTASTTATTSTTAVVLTGPNGPTSSTATFTTTVEVLTELNGALQFSMGDPSAFLSDPIMPSVLPGLVAELMKVLGESSGFGRCGWGVRGPCSDAAKHLQRPSRYFLGHLFWGRLAPPNKFLPRESGGK